MYVAYPFRWVGRIPRKKNYNKSFSPFKGSYFWKIRCWKVWMSTRRLFLKILMCLTNLIPSVRNDWKAIARNICSALFVEMQLIPKKLILRLMRSKKILPAMPLSKLLMPLLMKTFVKWKLQPLNCSSNTGTSKYFNFILYLCTHTKGQTNSNWFF